MTQSQKDFWNESIDAEEKFGCEILSGSFRGAFRSCGQRKPTAIYAGVAQEIIPAPPVGKADDKNEKRLKYRRGRLSCSEPSPHRLGRRWPMRSFVFTLLSNKARQFQI